jgi:hypothetical protein
MIDESVMHEIAASLGKDPKDLKATDITKEALALFRWAADKRKKGLEIFAADEDGPKEKVVTPLLSSIK